MDTKVIETTHLKHGKNADPGSTEYYVCDDLIITYSSINDQSLGFKSLSISLETMSKL